MNYSDNKKPPNIGRLFIWHPLRESNSQLTLRRGLLYPFNYGSVLLVAKKILSFCNLFVKESTGEKALAFSYFR